MLENQTGRMVDHRDTGNRMGPSMQLTQDVHVGRKMVNSGLSLKVLLLLTYICCSHAYLYNEPVFIDVDAIFGDSWCIEGTLSAIQSEGPIITSTADAPLRGGSGTEVRNEVPTSTDEIKHGATDANVTDLSNIKEKTPMCLVNELARFNKIQHQYRLTSEQGPAHKKRFTVTLKLGEEDYSAEGASIKKAQHMAASNALKSTTYRHPPPKTFKNLRLGKNNITPTVELNALAMKRGEPTVYTFVELPSFPPSPNTYNYQRGVYTQVRQPFQPNFAYDYGRRNITVKPTNPHMYQQQRYYGAKPPMYKVNVKVGDREFSGEGQTAQAARHDAASKALEQIRTLPLEENNVETNSACTAENLAATIEADSSSELKSPISLVHELALKRNLNVNFDVMSEKGPPHMKTFITRCTVGNKFESIGEGNGKKISKKRAAEKMLEKLRTLPPTTTITAAGCTGSLPRMKRKANPAKKKSRNLIKVINPNQDLTNKQDENDTPDELNPISRLIQIQQAKKEKEPVYTLMEERGQPRRREFSMEVTVGEHSFIGTGPNKKIAKRNAAEGLLQVMGYSSPSGKQRLSSVDVNRKVYSDNDVVKPSVGGSGGRQLVPGILLMTDPLSINTGKSNGYHSKHSTRMNMPGHSVNIQTTATIAKEYLNGGNSPTAEALGSPSDSKSTPAVRPKDQLLYLAQLLGFRVQFSDFPKGNHNEFLSLVSLSTDPPQVCHGAGTTTDLSHDQASLGALRALSEMGLDNVTPLKKESPNIGPGGDAIYLNKGGNIMKSNFVNGAPK